MRFSEKYKIAYALKPGDHQAGVDFDSFNLGLAHGICFMIQFAALTGDAVLTINSGATAGTKTTAETFNYRLASGAQAAASADLYGAWATSAGLTLTAATYQNKMLIVEIDAAALTDGQEYVTGAFSSAASALNASVASILIPRFPGDNSPTVL